jgi:hypothetical protein
MPSSGKLRLCDTAVNWSGTPAHARLWMNVENAPFESFFNKHFISNVLFSFTQQQWSKQSDAVLHPHVWCSHGNALPLLLIIVLKPGVKRFTSKHIEMTILIKDEDMVNLTAFDNRNLSFIIVTKMTQK